jgi:hypothetical protein
MKRKLIMMGLVSSSIIANAQVWTSGAGQLTTAGKVGIGASVFSPVQNQLEVATTDPNPGVGGITVTQNATTGSAALHLSTSNIGSPWTIYALGRGNHISTPGNDGDFSIYDWSTNNGNAAGSRLHIKQKTGLVGIGTSNPSLARLQVEAGWETPIGGWFTSNAWYSGSSGLSTGLVSQANGWKPDNSTANVGVDASADAGSTNHPSSSIGVWGTSYRSKVAIGGRFDAQGGSIQNSQNIGIFASTNGAATTNWAGYFAGNVYRSGTDNFTSDKKLKNDIQPLTKAVDKLMQLKPSTYTFKTEEFKAMNLPKGNQMGLIAQDLEKVLPELVTNMPEMEIKDKQGNVTTIPEFKSVQYIQLIPLLIGGLQEQQKMIVEQKNVNNKLQQQIDELKALVQSLAGSSNKTTAISTTVSDKNTVVLNQNVPNPFAESTIISYNIPDGFQKAQIIFSSIDGKVIKAHDIREKGRGSLNVFANDLSQGIYTYSLIVDSKMIDTKRMVKQ